VRSFLNFFQDSVKPYFLSLSTWLEPMCVHVTQSIGIFYLFRCFSVNSVFTISMTSALTSNFHVFVGERSEATGDESSVLCPVGRRYSGAVHQAESPQSLGHWEQEGHSHLTCPTNHTSEVDLQEDTFFAAAVWRVGIKTHHAPPELDPSVCCRCRST